MTVERHDGRREMLDLAHLADRHVRQGWVQTVHSSQGTTATRVLAHLESFRRPVDARALYVAVSRARDQAHLYTDDRTRLTTAIGLRDSSQAAALDHDRGWEFDDGIGGQRTASTTQQKVRTCPFGSLYLPESHLAL